MTELAAAPDGDSETCLRGHAIAQGDRFCTVCGESTDANPSEPPRGNEPASKRRKPVIVAGLAVAVVGIAIAIVAIAAQSGQSTKGEHSSKGPVPLATAVTNTLRSSNFTEQLTESTPQGDQSGHLVFQAPDRLAGYLDAGGRRTYLVVIGSTEYIAISTPTAGGSAPSSYFSQTSQAATAVDPVHTYLKYASQGAARHSGAVTTVTLRKAGQLETLVFTVKGSHVVSFHATTPGGSIQLTISNFGSSPSVALPAGAKIVSQPPTSSAASSG